MVIVSKPRQIPGAAILDQIAHIPEPVHQDAWKKTADPMFEHESATAREQGIKGEPSKFETFNSKLNICSSVLSGLIDHLPSLPEETGQHYRQLLRTLQDPNGRVVESLIKDLHSQRTLKAKYRDMVQKLVSSVDMSNGPIFPREPTHHEVSEKWATFYAHVMSTVGPNNIMPKISVASAGYLASSAENIAYGRISDEQLKSYIKSLSALFRSPHAQQSLFSALLCRWVFSTPEPMLRSMHSGGMMALYDGVISGATTIADGLAQVATLDKIAAKLMFEDSMFQNTETKHRIKVLKTSWQTMKDERCSEADIPSSMSTKKFAEAVIELKQLLLISPKEYRVQFVRPGTYFNPRGMQAYSSANDSVSDMEAKGSKVRLCLFPALVCENIKTYEDGTDAVDVLTMNKKFFVTCEEAIDFESAVKISKAAVLLS